MIGAYPTFFGSLDVFPPSFRFKPHHGAQLWIKPCCGAVGVIDLGGRGMPRPYDIAFWRAARRDHRGYGQKGNHKGCPYDAIIGPDPTVED